MCPYESLGGEDALRAAREALHVDRAIAAKACDVVPRTLSRWEAGASWPPLEDRFTLLRLLIDLPLPELEKLADLAMTTLGAAQTTVVPHPDDVVAPASVVLAPPSASAQKVLDDALREAAEDLAVHAAALRPVASRLLDAIAKTGGTLDVAARMVIGILKRPEKPVVAPTRAPPAATDSSQ